MPQKRKITLPQLKKALQSKTASVRYNAIFDFAHSGVTAEALPTLVAALHDDQPGVVRYAAECLGKLGPVALTFGTPSLGCPRIILELLQAAAKPAADSWMMPPQAYPHCLEALVKLATEEEHREWVVGLVHDYIGLTNWYPLKASLQALKTIGTPEALDLLKRAAAFWTPELDKKQKRIVEAILAGKYEGV